MSLYDRFFGNLHFGHIFTIGFALLSELLLNHNRKMDNENDFFTDMK